jgi:hypothetical protein
MLCPALPDAAAFLFDACRVPGVMTCEAQDRVPGDRAATPTATVAHAFDLIRARI